MLDKHCKKCNFCDFKSEETDTMDDHIKIVHGETSKTPPFKKRKKESEIEILMDTDEKEDLITKINNMTIKEKEEHEMKEKRKRSDLMDEKVKEKQRKYDEEEILYAEKRKREEENRKKIEEESVLMKKKEKKVTQKDC